MKYLYQAVSSVLRGDTDLKGMVGYTDANKVIRRGFQLIGEWEKLVVFYLQPDSPLGDFTPQIRQVPLIIRVYDREDELNCDDMSERIILLLNGTRLTVDGKIHAFDCSYSGEFSGGGFNDEVKAYEKVLRFVVTVRIDEIVGNSGYPDVTRQRNWHDND